MNEEKNEKEQEICLIAYPDTVRTWCDVVMINVGSVDSDVVKVGRGDDSIDPNERC